MLLLLLFIYGQLPWQCTFWIALKWDWLISKVFFITHHQDNLFNVSSSLIFVFVQRSRNFRCYISHCSHYCEIPLEACPWDQSVTSLQQWVSGEWPCFQFSGKLYKGSIPPHHHLFLLQCVNKSYRHAYWALRESNWFI